jgi:hypothetical protein
MGRAEAAEENALEQRQFMHPAPPGTEDPGSKLKSAEADCPASTFETPELSGLVDKSRR